ncbi:MAG: creatininase family protein [Cyanobacteria bacterium]|nr:creatininase family protein [Cyanobacteriota bacterium]
MFGPLKRLGSGFLWLVLGVLGLKFLASSLSSTAPKKASRHWQGDLLEDLTWQEAEKLLSSDAIIVIPLGASAKEHGPHLKLKNDFLLAEYLKDQVLKSQPVVVAPTITFSYYPAFVEYPGSISLRLETARDMLVDVCKSLASFGPRKFYVLNTGVSTLRPLEAAQELLAQEGILLSFTDISVATESVEDQVLEQSDGSHADEAETSMMLYIAPETVDMTKAVKDCEPYRGRLTRNPRVLPKQNQSSSEQEATSPPVGTYSPSGVWGDPTLANRTKGEKLVKALIETILQDLETLKQRSI